MAAGARKAAILLSALGSDLAAPLLRGLGEQQIEAVTREIVRMESVSDQEQVDVLRRCFEQVTARPGGGAGADYARELLTRSLGDRRADQVIARAADERTDGFAFVRKTDPTAVAAYLEGEHPQTIAIALAHMPTDAAGRILAGLPTELQADVAQRVVRMGKISPEIVQQVAGTMRGRLAIGSTEGLRSAGGMAYLVHVLGACDSRTEQSILEAIEGTDPDLARAIREQMFTFEDVTNLDDRSIQRVLRDAELVDVAIALRGATPEMQHAFTRNMSRRTAELLRAEIVRVGPVRVRMIEEAQHKIVTIARQLMEADEIVVARGRQDVFV
jgi:flagellar motor switch protein FliG